MTKTKGRDKEFANTILVVVVIASMLMMLTISSALFNNNSVLLPMASAQKPDNEFGTIASIQNGKDGKPEWVTSGIWDFKSLNSNSPMLMRPSICLC